MCPYYALICISLYVLMMSLYTCPPYACFEAPYTLYSTPSLPICVHIVRLYVPISMSLLCPYAAIMYVCPPYACFKAPYTLYPTPSLPICVHIVRLYVCLNQRGPCQYTSLLCPYMYVLIMSIYVCPDYVLICMSL
jgi:hypothetical protein